LILIKKSSLQNWVIVDDVVMGGESIGSFKLNEDGILRFQGRISWIIMEDSLYAIAF
jgi:hypothetical protein